MRRLFVCVPLLVVLLVPSSAAWAQIALPPEASLTLGGRLWFTSGYSLNSSEFSDLRWRGVDSLVPEVNIDFTLKRLVLMASLGGGAIRDGVLIDEDFTDSEHRFRFSRTRSDTDDTGLFFVNADVGYRLWRWGTVEDPGFVDALVGYQYWHERYVAFGATSANTAVVTPIASDVRVVTQDFHWHSFRLGGRAQVPLVAGFGLKARAFVIPWSKSIVEDIHHQRSDLLHDPSFRDEADGGIGMQLDGALTYRVWRGLFIEAGYQYWRITSGEGTSTARTPFGDFDSRLHENRTERYGPYVGARWRF
jgi:hypothetical protein